MSSSSDRSLPPGQSWRDASNSEVGGLGGVSLPISKVCVMGASGLVGSALCASLERAGVTVHRFSRAARPGFTSWDPQAGKLDTSQLSDADAVVNLAGENVGAQRWTPGRKHQLRESRIGATQLLASKLAALEAPPRVLINVSAVGYYGHRGAEAVYEDSAAGTGFMAELCRGWEAATAPAAARGIRVVLPRLGVVLTTEGGVLAKMLPPFRLGLGGRFGSGAQFMPWISMADAVSVLRFCMGAQSIVGPVNTVAPEARTNEQFTESISRIVHRPAWLPVPQFALRTALGELSQMLLEGANVRPRVLEQAGFRFDYPRLDDALDAIVG